jgi:nitroimidazol reductase NimA-like FMN-containing flavoprotein (pyridoxamine 5'-phosphate oxidase superfamily)
MAKQRDKIQMNEAEILALYDDAKSLNVATLDPTGAPHLTTLWYAPWNGKLIFETYAKAQKTLNLRRDPRIGAIVEAGTVYEELRGVSIQGRAEIVDTEPLISQLCEILLRRNTPMPEDMLKHAVARVAAKRVAVIIHPEKIMSWDHRKLGK